MEEESLILASFSENTRELSEKDTGSVGLASLLEETDEETDEAEYEEDFLAVLAIWSTGILYRLISLLGRAVARVARVARARRERMCMLEDGCLGRLAKPGTAWPFYRLSPVPVSEDCIRRRATGERVLVSDCPIIVNKCDQLVVRLPSVKH